MTQNKDYYAELSTLVNTFPRGWKKRVVKNTELMNWITEQTPLLNDPKYTLSTRVYWCLNHFEAFPECEICGKPLSHINVSVHRGYTQRTCSTKCGWILGDRLRRKQNLEKYGVEYYQSTAECKAKTEKTVLERYGVKNVWCSNGIGRETAKKTKIEKYGDPNFNNREQAAQTCIDRYGSSVPAQNPEIMKQMRDGFMTQIYEKLLTHEHIRPLFSCAEYLAKSTDTIFKWKCLDCEHEFEATINWNFYKDHIVKSVARCPYCFPILLTNGSSFEEKSLVEFIKSVYTGKVLENWKGLQEKYGDKRTRKEIDCYLPDLKLGFEYNGVYFHQFDPCDANRHLHKTRLAEQQGIMLVQLRSDQWNYDRDVWKTFCQTMILDRQLALNLLYDCSQKELLVDRALFNSMCVPCGYQLVEEIPPTRHIIKYCGNTYVYEDCGLLRYQSLEPV